MFWLRMLSLAAGGSRNTFSCVYLLGLASLAGASPALMELPFLIIKF